MALKNLWSLSIDEALAADVIKRELGKKDYEVFFPVNAQLKDVDLVLLNLKKMKVSTMQVKGSRTYEPKESQRKKYGEGCAAWITINKKSIFKPSNKVDFFIFVLHSMIDGLIKKEIKINYLVVPINDFRKVASKKVVRGGNKYHFFVWVDTKGKRSFDFNNKGGKTIQLSKFLNNWKLLKK
jgi:hypothetical protein